MEAWELLDELSELELEDLELAELVALEHRLEEIMERVKRHARIRAADET